MTYVACEDCGCRIYGRFCTNCHEEVFIEAQYLEDGECAPQLIADLAQGHRDKKLYREATGKELP
jgi:hypothetical protein